MSNEMNVNEMLSELDRINSLYERHQSLTASMDNIVVEQNKENDNFAVEIVQTLNGFREKQDQKFGAKKPTIAPDCLVTLPEPPNKPNSSNPTKDIIVGAVSGLIMLACAALWLIMVILNPDTSALGLMLAYISPLLLLASAAYWFMKGSTKVTMFIDWQNKQQEWKEKQRGWETKFNKSATKEENDRFLNEFKEYDACFLKLVEDCSQKYAKELKRYEEGLEAIKEKYLRKLEQIHSELLEVSEQLDNVTLIHSDLFSNAWRISSMLKTGRADSLKEAINLALDEERKDIEEATRRAEARHQEEILEQQAQDNRMHNAAMQRAAEEEARAMRAHNAAMERAAQEQAQAREAAKQSEIAQKQARDAERAASARCAGCVNNMKCSFRAKQNSGTCSAYRPR